jgi:S1-C subfamily serine protease
MPAALPLLLVLSAAPDSEYVSDFQELAPEAREYEQQQAPYTFCVRTTAVYECPVYRADGSLRHLRKTSTAHGTAFAYRQDGADTLLLTNDHVAEWPVATEDAHSVDGVPAGCRLVSNRVRIVDNDQDDYERDDTPLALVVADPALDMAVLRAHKALPVMPWKVGKSALLREQNIVDVRGFPLGAFKANNVGKVISAYDRDDYKSWEHDDFVIDALLSPGNSGSPVFAVSRKTGQFELVGVYHAGYNGGSALNLVVGIDQIRDLMTDLKRTTHTHSEDAAALDAQSRAAFVERVRTQEQAFFPLGNLVVQARALPDGALLYEIEGADFPLQSSPIAVLEDLPPEGKDVFGTLGRMWFGGPPGLKAVSRSSLGADTQAQVAKVLDAVRHDGTWALTGQALDGDGDLSRDRFEKKARFTRAFKRGMTARQDMTQAFEELAGKLGPQDGEAGLHVASVLAPPPPEPMSVEPVATALSTQGTAPAVFSVAPPKPVTLPPPPAQQAAAQ